MKRILIMLGLLLLPWFVFADAPRWYVVLFTVDGCHFCEMMRDKVIKPMIITGELPERRFYEINMTDKGEWFYFDPMDTYLQKRDLYKRYDLGLFPTTVILDGHASLLGPKLVGITTPEAFRLKLQTALASLSDAPSQ